MHITIFFTLGGNCMNQEMHELEHIREYCSDIPCAELLTKEELLRLVKINSEAAAASNMPVDRKMTLQIRIHIYCRENRLT